MFVIRNGQGELLTKYHRALDDPRATEEADSDEPLRPNTAWVIRLDGAINQLIDHYPFDKEAEPINADDPEVLVYKKKCELEASEAQERKAAQRAVLNRLIDAELANTTPSA